MPAAITLATVFSACISHVLNIPYLPQGPECPRTPAAIARVMLSVPASKFERSFFNSGNAGFLSSAPAIIRLDDGTIVTASFGLYRVTSRGAVERFWTTDGGQPDWFDGGMPGVVVGWWPDNEHLIGIRLDGTQAFSFPAPEPNVVTYDGDGTLWFSIWGPPPAVYAVSNESGTANLVPEMTGLLYAFNGRAYSRSQDGSVVLLRGFSHVTFRTVSRTVRVGFLFGADGLVDLPLSAVGPDGSLWGSDVTSLVHLHPDGSIREIVLKRIPKNISHLPMPIAFHLARDGTVWLSSVVRVLNNDQIQEVRYPPGGMGPSSSVTPAADGSIWYYSMDQANLVHARLALTSI